MLIDLLQLDCSSTFPTLSENMAVFALLDQMDREISNINQGMTLLTMNQDLTVIKVMLLFICLVRQIAVNTNAVLLLLFLITLKNPDLPVPDVLHLTQILLH